jgi:hypothetical protein
MLHVEATKNLASDGAGAPLAESRNAMAKVCLECRCRRFWRW